MIHRRENRRGKRMPGPAGKATELSFAIEKSIAEVLHGLCAVGLPGIVRGGAAPRLRTSHDGESLEFRYGFRLLELWRARLVFEQEGLRSTGRVSIRPARPRLGRAALRAFLAEFPRAVRSVDPEAVVRRQSTPRIGGWWKVAPKTRSEAPTRSR